MTTASLWAEFAPEVYRRWSAYWLSAGWAPPPLRLHKPTVAGGAIFHAPVASPWVRQFIDAHRDDVEFYFENQGEELPASDASNLGTWGSFSAIRRSDLPQPVARPLLPMPMPIHPSPDTLREVKRRTRQS